MNHLITLLIRSRLRCASHRDLIWPGLAVMAFGYLSETVDDAAFHLILGEVSRSETVFTFLWWLWILLPFIPAGEPSEIVGLPTMRLPLGGIQRHILFLIEYMTRPATLVCLVITGYGLRLLGEAPLPLFAWLAGGSSLVLMIASSILIRAILALLAVQTSLRFPVFAAMGLGLVSIQANSLPGPPTWLSRALIGSTPMLWLLISAVPVVLVAIAGVRSQTRAMILRGSRANRRRDFHRRLLPVPGGPRGWVFYLVLNQARRSLEPWLALLVVVGNANLLLTEPVAEALWFAIALLVLVHGGLLANTFGHDGPGFARCALWPIPPETLLRNRNLAIGAQIAIPVCIVSSLGALSVHPMVFVHGLCQASATFFIASSIGHRTSIDQPRRRGFLPRAGLSPIGMFLMGSSGALFFLVALISWREFGPAATIAFFPVVYLCFVFWKRSLADAGSRFAADLGRMAAALSN